MPIYRAEVEWQLTSLYGLPRKSNCIVKRSLKNQTASLYPAVMGEVLLPLSHAINRALRPHSVIGLAFGQNVSQVRATPV